MIKNKRQIFDNRKDMNTKVLSVRKVIVIVMVTIKLMKQIL